MTEDSGMIEIKEGLVSMFYAKNEEVFYNKVQVFNRDMSIQVIRLFAEIRDAEKKAKYEKKLQRYTEQQQQSSSSSSKQKGTDRPPMAPTYGVHVLDALAATGLRSVRYLKECPGVRHVTINDLLPAATAAARVTCERNGIKATIANSDHSSSTSASSSSSTTAEEPPSNDATATIHTGDAIMLMYQRCRDPLTRFDVIDLDPYGTAAPFLDSAVQAVDDGGLLCVTCTDMTVLGGSYPEVCYAKYGSMPVKAKYVHEMSLRVLLHAIDCAANKYGRHIVPWLSLSVDFYVRVFVRVYDAPAEVKKTCLRRVLVHQSVQCPSFYLQPIGQVKSGRQGGDSFSSAFAEAPTVCPETGGRMRIGGPFWGESMHNQEIVDALLKRVEEVDEPLPFPVPTAPRVKGVLTAISEELKDVVFFYHLPELASALHATVPTMLNFQSALANLGYRVSQFHHEPHAIKTDAPAAVVWDIMRAHCQLHPPLGSSHKTQAPSAAAILSKAMTNQVNFDAPAHLQEKRKKAARWAPNPEEGWGPKRRAGRGGGGGSAEGGGDGPNGEEVEENEGEEVEEGKEPSKRLKSEG